MYRYFIINHLRIIYYLLFAWTMSKVSLCRSAIQHRCFCTTTNAYFLPRRTAVPLPSVPFREQRPLSRNYYSSTMLMKSTAESTAIIQKQQQQHNHQNFDDGNETTTTSLSARKLFQQIPIHPSILEYIRTIGVGIVPRDTSGRRSRHRRKRMIHNDDADENHRHGEHHNRPINSRQRTELHSNDDTAGHNQHKSDELLWMPPPPPFGPKSLPVQLISSAGPRDIIAVTPSSEQSSSNDTTTTNTTNNIPNIFPKNQSCIPEVAIIGRSNVGKSTLLNALLYGNRDPTCVVRPVHKQRGRVPINMKIPKGIKATMSDKPGETKCISFYKLQHIEDTVTTVSQQESNDHKQQQSRSLLLVDLPGYGFAYAKEEDTILYQTLIRNYLLHRPLNRLQRVLLLIDARHGMKKADIDFVTMLEEQHIQNVQQQQQQQAHSTTRKNFTLPFSIQIVLTKCDLVLQTDLARRVTLVRQQLSDILRREPSTYLPIMLVSARAGIGYNNVDPRKCVTRGGIYELQKELATLAQPRTIHSSSKK
jgi:GTP-binding protein